MVERRRVRILAPLVLSLFVGFTSGCPSGYVGSYLAGRAAISTNGRMWIGYNLETLAGQQLKQGLTAEAAQSARSALDVFEEVPPDENCHIVSCLLTLGAALKDDPSRRAEAIEALQRSIALAETGGDNALPFLSSSLGCLGDVFVKSGDVFQAEPLLQRVLTLNEQHTDPYDNKAYAKCLHNLGVIRLMQGRMDEGRDLFERAIVLLTEKGETESAEMAMAVNGKAFVLFRAGEYEQAKSLMMKATTLLEKVKGPDDLELAKMQYDLACVQKCLGEYDDARRLCNHALAVHTQQLEPGSPEIDRIRKTLDGLPVERGS